MAESYEHKKAVKNYLEELNLKGYKTINLKGKSPDGIAVKDNQIYAVEILLRNNSSKYHSTSMKRNDYFMFDGVLIKRIKKEDIK